jgi:hypothetical protein
MSTNNAKEAEAKKEEELRTLKNHRTTVLGNVTKQKNDLVDLMTTSDNLHLVKSAFDVYNERYGLYKTAHEEYTAAIEIEAEKDKEETRFTAHQTSIINFRQQVQNWIKQSEDILAEDLSDGSSTKKSRKTRKSQKSNVSVKSARLLEEAKLAELKATKTMLQKQQAIQAMQLEMDLAKAEARAKVFAKFDENQDGMNEYFDEQGGQKENGVPPLTDTSPPGDAQQSSSPGDMQQPSSPGDMQQTSPPGDMQRTSLPGDMQQKFTEAASQPVASSLNFNAPAFFPNSVGMMNSNVLAAISLPQPELPKFGGEVIDFRSFIMAFDSRVASKLTFAADKLYYLNQLLVDDPKDIISGCMHMDPDSGYTEARSLLEREYGDPYKIGMVFLQKIHTWPNIRADDCSSLKKFSLFLVKCQTAMKTVSYLEVLNHPPNMLNIVQKLPVYLQHKWRDQASRMRLEQRKIMGYPDLVKFVTMAAEAATDPVYGRSSRESSDVKRGASGSAGSTKIKPKNSTSFATAVSTAKGDKIICALCKRHHDIEDCIDFKKKNIEEKRQFIREKRLCFGCLGFDHVSKGCRTRRKCASCGKGHPTSLHVEGFSLENRSSTASGTGKQPQINTQQSSSVNQAKRSDGKLDSSACTATEVCSSPILHAILPVKICQQGGRKCVDTYAFYDNGSSGCFITEELRDQLGVTGVGTTLQLRTMHGCDRSSS